MGLNLKLLLRQSLMPFIRYVDRNPRFKKRLMRIARSIPALEYRLRSIRLGLSSFGSETRVSDIVFDDPVDRDTGSLPVALPWPQGRRVIYIFAGQAGQAGQSQASPNLHHVTRILAASLARLGECVRYVEWDSVNGQCRLINADERSTVASWGEPEINAAESLFYPPEDVPQEGISPRAASENHWLIVPEVTHSNQEVQSATLDLLLWSRRMGLKSGFIFHDAQPLRCQDLSALAPLHFQYMRQLLLADVVWPISKFSARDLLSYWAIQEGADEKTQPEVKTLTLPVRFSTVRRYQVQVPIEPLILSVGSIEPSRNQGWVIAAFERHKIKHPLSPWRLCLIGKLHPLVEGVLMRAMSVDSSIGHVQSTQQDELDALHHSCAFTVYPAIEGDTYIPILESLWFGKPCVCSDVGTMAEIALGGGCLTVDMRREDLLAGGLTKLIDSEDLRMLLTRQALARPVKSANDYAGEICARIDLGAQPEARVGHIYYWIDATLQFNKNTGIQRVSRQLAKALVSLRIDLIPVKWNESVGQFGPVSEEELTFFSGWNGPRASAWHEWVAPIKAPPGSWFFMPELPLNVTSTERLELIRFVRQAGLRCAAVFYDAIPWKMRAIYPPHFSQAHREYMVELDQYDLVFPISSYSGHDLVSFLGAALPKPQSLDSKIKTVTLPGEFPESGRSVQSDPVEQKQVTILCVGTVEPRKNHEMLLNAFVMVGQRTKIKIRLVLAGGSHSIEPALAVRVRELVKKHSEITWEESVNDSRLRELHEQCDFTIYPSLEEGFGLPILESLWYGKPCICANFGAMKEVADGGGCLTVDVRNIDSLAEALQKLSEDDHLRADLRKQAWSREFKSWHDYAREIATRLADATPALPAKPPLIDPAEMQARAIEMGLAVCPTLSICISTFNRAEWLASSLKNWAAQYPIALADVELLVCDNTSTDSTPEVVKPYLQRPDFSYHRNPKNVGMLGNLRETANHARGKYIWILGDDDLLLPGSIERVLSAIASHPRVALVYLNYAFTRVEDARTVSNFEAFFREACPVVPAEPDRSGPIASISARNENFFTAIYTLVFRRDHAVRAYSQDTSGRPFSTMPTCIPTTTYVLNHMMDEPGVWIGAPQLVVNLNVSWIRYAPLWILERLPEVYEVAEKKGAAAEDVDRWRRHSLVSIEHYFREIFSSDPLNNAAYFSASRLVRRFKHLPEFTAITPSLKLVYSRAHASGHPAAKLAVDRVFPEIV